MFKPEVNACMADLNNLGKFEPLERNFAGTLVTNDEGYKEALLKLNDTPNQKLRLGVFIGSGGMLSMLSELPIDIAVQVDRNTAVLDLNSILISLVRESNSPSQAMNRLSSGEIMDQKGVLKGIVDLYGDLELTKSFITHEKREFKTSHWTDPVGFVQTKQALDVKPVMAIAADITNPDLALKIGEVAKTHGAEITFANFTNVHQWISPKPMDFVRAWPFSDRPQIMYSSHEGRVIGDWPAVRLTTSIDDYISATKRDSRS